MLFGLPSKKEAKATSFHTVWSPYGPWSGWSDCEANKEEEDCGVVGGTTQRHRTRVCLLVPGGGGNQCAFGTTDTQYQYDECGVELPACVVPEPPKLCEDKTSLNYGDTGDCRYSGASSALVGPSCEAPTWAPTITEVGRVDSDTIFVEYTPVRDDINTYLVWYGLSQDNLLWNVITEGERVEISGQELVGRHVWVKVAGYDEGCTGNFSLVVDP